MGGEDDGAVIVFEVVLEPPRGFQVEVVGRLVEDEQIGVEEEQFSQFDARQPAAAEFRKFALEVGGLKTQPHEDHFRLVFGIVAARSFVLVLHVAEFPHQRRHAFLVFFFRQVLLKHLHFVFQPFDVGGGLDYFIQQPPLRCMINILVQVADGGTFAHGDAAAIRRDRPGDDLKKGSFTGAVRPDDGYTVAHAHVKGHAFKEVFGIIGFGYI